MPSAGRWSGSRAPCGRPSGRASRHPRDDGALVRAMLDSVAAVHPSADALLDVCRTELAGIEAFCRDRGVIGLADEPLAIEWTPLFLRSFAGAMLLAPGPLDRGLRTFFYVTPFPAAWTPDEVESALREDNDRMLRLLVIHEAVPGHYLQGVYANRAASLVRTAFASGVFAEGWAVYVTQVMIDRGYGADDPGLLLTHWKFYLRSVINALLDIGIHTRRDGRGRGDRADGRGRLPGARRGGPQVRTRPALVDPALRVLRRLHLDVGHRG